MTVAPTFCIFSMFCAAIDADQRGSSRGGSRGLVLSFLGLRFTQKMKKQVLLVHAPSSQRAQGQDALFAIAEKNAALAAAEAPRPPAGVPKARPKAAASKQEAAPADTKGAGSFAHSRRPDLRGEITGALPSATEPHDTLQSVQRARKVEQLGVPA